jgi:hypothetical protein
MSIDIKSPGSPRTTNIDAKDIAKAAAGAGVSAQELGDMAKLLNQLAHEMGSFEEGKGFGTIASTMADAANRLSGTVNFSEGGNGDGSFIRPPGQ